MKYYLVTDQELYAVKRIGKGEHPFLPWRTTQTQYYTGCWTSDPERAFWTTLENARRVIKEHEDEDALKAKRLKALAGRP